MTDGCFTGLAVWRSCWPRSSPPPRRGAPDDVPLDAPDAVDLPELPGACRTVEQRHSGALRRRRLQVTAQLLPIAARIAWQQATGSDQAVENTRRLQHVLEALGPAFVKLGQAAACREDILSQAVAAELRKLCDQVAPFDHLEARRLVECQLGGAAAAAAAARVTAESCVAAASLGQVYRIQLHGQTFAMKVQRPGLNRALAIDVVILKGMARVLRWLVRHFMAASVDPVQIVDDWAKTLWDELDYKKDTPMPSGKTNILQVSVFVQLMEDMRHALCGSVKGLVIPRVQWPLTSLREWVEGQKLTEFPRAVKNQHVGIGVEAFAAMILDVGVVHADPHPGNFIVTGDAEICLLDFGMVCRVPEAHRRAWAQCVVDLVRKDHSAVLDDLIEIGFFPADCPRHEILPVMSKIWAKLSTEVRRFEFSLPDYYVALVRALLTLEGIALAADCNFDIFEAAFPVALRFLSSPRRGLGLSSAGRWGARLLQNRQVARLVLRSANMKLGGVGTEPM
eukprot:g6368.t2